MKPGRGRSRLGIEATLLLAGSGTGKVDGTAGPATGLPPRSFSQGIIMQLTRSDVIRACGAIDDVAVAEILATGATADELAEAQAWLANDEPMMNSGRPLATGRVGRLVEILADVEDDEEIGPTSSDV